MYLSHYNQKVPFIFEVSYMHEYEKKDQKMSLVIWMSFVKYIAYCKTTYKCHREKITILAPFSNHENSNMLLKNNVKSFKA